MDFEQPDFKQIENILTEKVIPSYDLLFSLTEKASDLLETEICDYRKADSSGNPGGVISFLDDTLPLVVVPDLHARPDFLLNILNYKIDGQLTIYQALCMQKLRLVFVGDILHTEHNTKERWLAAQAENLQENFTGPAMMAEMQEGLTLLCGLLQLKLLFPSFCHILKGNHENIYNQTGDGDYGFRKYADEGNMCRIFIQEYFGDDILYMIHCVEKALPLIFAGKNCVVSHAEPVRSFTKQELIDGRLHPEVVEGLTWTSNGEAENGSVEGVIKNLTEKTETGDYVYLGGHRPVLDNYCLRQNGLYIQIHNPTKQNVAFVKNNKKFNPDEDIVEVADE